MIVGLFYIFSVVAAGLLWVQLKIFKKDETLLVVYGCLII